MARNKRARNSDSRRYFDWLEHANEDIEAAAKLVATGSTLNAAAFHCQQCIEKALKGYILFKTHQHVDGHNLTWLCQQAMKIDKRFTEWLDESVALNRYYIETRYPADIPLKLDNVIVNNAYEMAHAMYHFICSQVYVDDDEQQ
jgi:HEPN domain-containing protein